MSEKMVGKGLVGLSRCFKEAITTCGKSGNLLFVGSPFTCLPFAEFLSYAIRDMPIKVHFSPNGELDKIACITNREGYGFNLGEVTKERNFDIVVLLGGLAMPTSKVSPKDLKKNLEKVSKLDLVIGFYFQGIMNKPEWINEFNIRYMIDGDLSKVALIERAP
jgi:hypothetical protein